MILGITLNRFAKIRSQGDNVKCNFLTKILLEKKPVKKFKCKEIQDLTLDQLVNAEMYLEDEDYTKFCSIFVMQKWWQTIYIHNMSFIIMEFLCQQRMHYELYDFIFDPPQYVEDAKETTGSELKREFVERFGNYVVLMDVICKGDMTKYKAVEQWKVSEFFFWANYLTGQRIIEGVK
jgi:hypothetical protein